MNWDLALRLFNLALLAFFFIVTLTYVYFFVISFLGLIEHRLRTQFATPNEILRAQITPPISILAPAYNEEVNVVASVHSLLRLKYNEFEVVVINDGSKDRTLAVLQEAFDLRKTSRDYNRQIPTKGVKAIYKSRTHPNLLVLDKDNGGKADSLNAGINASTYPLFCCIDADSILEPHSLLQVVHPFMEAYGEVVATGGLVRVANGCSFMAGRAVDVTTSGNWLVDFQIVEYFRAFLTGRMGLSMMNGLLVISGAFGLFKKQAVIDVGGYRTDVVGEDMELVVRLHHVLRAQGRPCRIVFIPDPVCWTEVPENLRVLGRQRNRWQRGLAESLFAHLGMLFNPRYGAAGLIAMPYFVFIELLSPVLELFGYVSFTVGYARGTVAGIEYLAFFLLSVVFGVVLSLLALLMEEVTFRRYPKPKDLLRLIAAAALENFGYRQWHGYVRLMGLIDWMRGRKVWGAMERTGSVTAKKPA